MDDDSFGSGPDARLAQFLIRSSVAHAAQMAHQLMALGGGFRGLSIEHDVAYGSLPEQRLDVWRPARASGPLPVVLYFHGGGFQHLDRHSHWVFAERFARAGALVLSADYRLAPRHRYPAAAEDAALAYRFLHDRLELLGGDRKRVILAGTSAGANLALGLGVASTSLLPGPCARTVRETGLVPQACVLFSGLLQVSDMARLYRARPLHRLVRARIASIALDYLGSGAARPLRTPCDALLDPLLWIEALPELPPQFPALFCSVGTADPVLDDAERLAAALARLHGRHRLDCVEGAGHAFQGLLLRARARDAWTRCIDYLRELSLIR